MFLDNKAILITGGTGSFGNEMVSYLLKNTKCKKIIIFSRDEIKQWEMNLRLKNNKRLRFFIGDIRDKERLYRALNGVDYVVHAAATKIVPTAEYNPMECIKTNVIGAMNIIEACTERGIKKLVALSTDKASSPINLYGASKLASDKLFIAANSYLTNKETRFAIVRYGNVMGSRGSIIPFFKKQFLNNEPITVTDVRMTRFITELDDCVKLVMLAFNDMSGGEIYVNKLKSIKIIDIAECFAKYNKIKVIGIRPGEKLHEQMISAEDSPYTYEYKSYYKILPSIFEWYKDIKKIKNGKLVKTNFNYDSLNNKNWMSKNQFAKWLKLRHQIPLD